MVILNYPLQTLDFRPWAQSVLSVDRLEYLHLCPDPKPFANYVERLSFYTQLLKRNFMDVQGQYDAIISIVSSYFGGIELLQSVPSFRCHLSGAGTASAFHRDGDSKYGVPPGTINGWLPLTAVNGNNSISVETRECAEEYRPVSMVPSQILIFDAFHLKHGSYANDTPHSRISFDFRFIPNDQGRARDLGFWNDHPFK